VADRLSPERRAILGLLRGEAPPGARERRKVADELEKLWHRDYPRAKKQFGREVRACFITHQLSALVHEYEQLKVRNAVKRALEDLAGHWRSVADEYSPHFASGEALGRWLRRNSGWKRWGQD
jgi:hypothetical protein